MEVNEYLYCVLDHVSGELREFTVATSDGLAVRRILSTLRVPLKDCTCYCVGEIARTFNESQQFIDVSNINFAGYDSFRLVDWSCYRFPESKAESLAPLGVDISELESKE